jgi:4-hydroxybenzoate polyprenyltransferase
MLSPDLDSTGDSTLVGIAYELRPWQWYKQLVLFVAVLFSGNATDFDIWLRVTTGAVLFSVVAGATYILNDVSDVEEDRNHPVKRHRPIASGQVSVPTAVSVSAVLYILAGALSWRLSPTFFGLIALYIGQNVAYSYVLKDILFVDLLTISTGFVIRAIAGVVLVGSPLSPWLLLCAFLAALMLGISKRWGEHATIDESAETRKTLNIYTEPLLQFLFGSVATTLLMSYSLYTFFASELAMMLTIPFAFYAVFRFSHLTFVEAGASRPQEFLVDRMLLTDVTLWGAVILFVLYGPDTGVIL